MPVELLAINLAITLLVMVSLWGLSLLRRDVSLVDLYWGPGFAVIAWSTFVQSDAHGPRQWLLCAIVTAWAARLGLYLYSRAKGKSEDPRYAAMREGRGAAFWWQSLYVVFGLQAVLMWVISMPIQIGLTGGSELGIVEVIGTAIALSGLLIETVADRQLVAFKATNSAAEAIMDRGLWRYSRHPNYFGETVYVWGVFIFACGHSASLWTVFAPALMTFLILRVSGVRLLEEALTVRKPDYAAYAAVTARFIPKPPRRERPVSR